MICQPYRGFVMTLGLLALAPSVQAQDPAPFYLAGNQAYQGKQWIAAIENLYAYRALAGQSLASNPELAGTLNAAIQFIERKLDVAVRTRDEIEKHGEVTEIRIAAGGKMDEPGQPATLVSVRIPGGSGEPPVTLPAAAPSNAAPAAGGALIMSGALSRSALATAVVAETPEQTTARLQAQRQSLVEQIRGIDAALDSLGRRPRR